MRLIEQLAALQKLDSDYDAARKRYAEIQEALKEPESLRQAKAVRDETAGRVEHWGTEHRQAEAAVSDQNARIKAQEDRLYGGRIKDAREQVAAQQNVEALKRHLESLEETALETILELEQAESDLAAAKAALDEEQASFDAAQKDLLAERETLIAGARKLKAARDAQATTLQPVVLKRYEALRERRGGVAVIALQGDSCGACGAQIPTAVRQQVYGDALVACPICTRLLNA